MSINRDNSAGFLIGLLAGVLTGGVIALLYAPVSGKEARKVIKGKAKEVGIKARALVGKSTIKDVKGE